MNKPRKNMAKFLTYKTAWGRINAAMAAGFHFEVIALCESIISDRLLSHMLGADPTDYPYTLNTDLNQLINRLRKHTKRELLQLKDGRQLPDALALWREDRNHLLHGFAKTWPAAEPPPVDSLLDRAHHAAVEGVLLAKATQAFHKSQLPPELRKPRARSKTRAKTVRVAKPTRRGMS